MNPSHDIVRHRVRGGGLVSVLLAALSAGATAQQGADVSATRTALEKWGETRRLISEEKRDWQLGKETLRDRIELLQREIASMRTRIAENEQNIRKAEEQRAELADKEAAGKLVEDRLRERVVQLERSVLELLPRLPEPLRDEVRPISQLIPENPEETKQRLDERYRNVLFVCKKVHKWNREITLKSEVRTMPDGSSVEVAVMYVGIGQAYYAGANGKVAGTGTATPNGWVWSPANELAAEIAAAIAILKNEKVAAFVRLPVQIL